MEDLMDKVHTEESLRRELAQIREELARSEAAYMLRPSSPKRDVILTLQKRSMDCLNLLSRCIQLCASCKEEPGDCDCDNLIPPKYIKGVKIRDYT